MKQEEKWKEAFARAAMEQTEELENSLTGEERRKAEALYRRHRDTVLRQIRKPKVSVMKWAAGTVAAAAAVLLILWGANRSTPDLITPAAAPEGTAASVQTAERSTETAAPAAESTPFIPALEAHLVHFPQGKRYAVYTGPGENYERANQNKAAVSTNDWIEVFGVENGYVMIQYAITPTQRRIGYMDASALPANEAAAALEFSAVPVVILRETELTDDPLGEKTPLHLLPAGAEARWLASLNGWAYLEWTGGDRPVRGFVSADAIRQKSAE